MDTQFKKYSPVVLRVGVALVFLWFGVEQIINPIEWIGYIPEAITSLLPISSTTIVYLNGIFEIVFSSALLFGFFTRFTALLLAIHMFDITYIVGFDATGVRDFGLSIATLCVFLNGSDWFSLDHYNNRHNSLL